MTRQSLGVLFAFLVWCGTAHAGGRAAIFPQLGHAGAVGAVAFSRDGTLLASASADSTIKFWDLASGRELRTLNGHTDTVSSIAFAPNGKVLASASGDKTVKLWDAVSGRALRTLHGKLRFTAVAYSSDGKVIVAAGNPNLPSDGIAVAIERWDVASGRELNAPPATFMSSAFSANGKLAVAIDWKGNAVISDLASGRTLHVLKGFGNQNEAIAFSPDGKVLVTQTFNEGIKLRDAASGRLVLALPDSGEPTSFFGFSPNGKLLFSDGGHNSIVVWDIAGGGARRELDGKSLYGDSQFLSVAFSPDGKLLAAGNQDTAITVWNIASGRVLHSLVRRSGFVRSVAYSPDGAFVGVGNGDGAALWNAATGREARNLTGDFDSGIHDTSAIAFAPDSQSIATNNFTGLQLWKTSDGANIRTLDATQGAFAMSPDGKYLAAYGGNDTIQLWDVASGNAVRSLQMDTQGLAPNSGRSVSYVCMSWCRAGPSNACGISLAFSPDGTLLAQGSVFVSGLTNNFVRLFDVASGKELRKLGGTFQSTCSVAFSHDATLLATGTSDGTLLWDAASGRELRTLSGSAKMSFAAFSPDRRFVVSGSNDNKIGLWDVASGRQIRSFIGHSGLVTSASFSADSKVLVSGSDDGTTRVWDAATGKERVTLISFEDGSTIAVTPEGYFASSSEAAEEYLNVRIGNRVFGISSFREKFYRPDLVQQALAGASLLQYGTIDNVKLSPVVEFEGLPADTPQSNLKLTVRLTNAGGGFGPVRVFWNGTVITEDNNIPTRGGRLTRSYTVPLLSGENDLRASASNIDGSMWSALNATVTANLPPVAKTMGAHGTLHALVVGIQSFPKAPPKDQLAFPSADAELIAKTLREKSGPLFDNVDVQLLTGADNTDKIHVTQALKAMQAAAKPEDEFVFYAASHGYVVGGEYFLLTSNVAAGDAPTLKQQAISGTDLSDLLANIHVAKKLVMLDTCDAGAAGATLSQSNAGLTARDATTILARDYGFTVLAATQSDQEANEAGYNGHGVFTSVVADGLSGKAADAASGVVDSGQLADYVNMQVPLLAETVLRAAQQPVSEKSGQAFAVTKVK